MIYIAKRVLFDVQSYRWQVLEVDKRQIERVLWESPLACVSDDESSEYMHWKRFADHLVEQYIHLDKQGAITQPESVLLAYGRYLPQTLDRLEDCYKEGFVFFVGNNCSMDKRAKWKKFHLVRVAKTNSKKHGYTVKTIWAAKPKSADEMRRDCENLVY